ncbi:hypothetical protein MKW92_047498 [Papaver armeniacum]|nr:hypothetical protein MKW92_047498 [Papaver armeniacum]
MDGGISKNINNETPYACTIFIETDMQQNPILFCCEFSLLLINNKIPSLCVNPNLIFNKDFYCYLGFCKIYSIYDRQFFNPQRIIECTSLPIFYLI